MSSNTPIAADSRPPRDTLPSTIHSSTLHTSTSISTTPSSDLSNMSTPNHGRSESSEGGPDLEAHGGPGPSTHRFRLDNPPPPIPPYKSMEIQQPTPDRRILPMYQREHDRHTSNTSSTSSSSSTARSYLTHPDSNTRSQDSRRHSENSTNPTTAPSSPVLERTWRPTSNVPEHIARRHRTARATGENRWLSDDEGRDTSSASGEGSRAIGRRRRGSGAAGSEWSSSGDLESNSGSTSRRDRSVDRERIKHTTNLPPKLNIHITQQRPHHPHVRRPELGSRRRSSPAHVRQGSNRSTPTPPPSNLGSEPPQLSDLVPAPNNQGGMRVLRTQRALIDPPPRPEEVQVKEELKVEPMEGVEPEENKEDQVDRADRGEDERRRVWRAGLLGQLKKLLTCTLCPPGNDQLLHHPLTLPCGHTLSSEHLSLPLPAPLPANFASLPPHDQHALTQQQSKQRLSLWAGIMCPIPSCKRYSPYALPGGLSHEPLSPIAAFHAPLASLQPDPTPAAALSLPSGVMYYPPPQTPPLPSPMHVQHPPPAYSTDPPVNETGGSMLLDTAVDKVMSLVMRELGLGPFSRGLILHNYLNHEAEHAKIGQAETAEAKIEEITGNSSHTDRPRITITPPRDRPTSSGSATRPPPVPLPTSDAPAGIDSGAKGPDSTDSMDSTSSLSRKVSKRQKNIIGEPTRPELSFEKELMGILECDVCSLLLYEPITTPCQHSFCLKCLCRSLDHSPRCPVCRQDLPGYSFFQDAPVNRVLLTIIKTSFPTEYIERQEGIEKDERDARLDTPIFICTLAFPGMPTILHVFEPRYRLMIRRCIESSSPRFGMLMPTRGSDGVGDYGTMLEIQSVQMLPDGRSLVETIGTQRFRLLEKGGLDGYTVGRIEVIDDISAEEEAALETDAVREAATEPTPPTPPTLPPSTPEAVPLPTTSPFPGLPTSQSGLPQTPTQPILTPDNKIPTSTAELMAVCHSFIDQLRSGSAPWLLQRLNTTYGTMPDDPGEFSYWMAMVMPIDENEKARLLPIRSARLRLKLIVHWVESLRGSWWFSSGCVVG